MDLVVGVVIFAILIGNIESTFDDYLDGAACNQTITMATGKEGGTVEFQKTTLSPATMYCTVELQAPENHFISLSALRRHHDVTSGNCDIRVTIDNSTNNNHYCSYDANIPEVTGYNASVLLTYECNFTINSYVQFLFYMYREGHCSDSEEECDNYQPKRCLPEDLVCLNPYSVCGDKDHCEDKIPTTTIVIATVATLVVLIVAFIVAMVIHVRVCSRHKTEPLPLPSSSRRSSEDERRPISATNVNFRVPNLQPDVGDLEGRMSPPPSYNVAIGNDDRNRLFQSRRSSIAYESPPSFRENPPSYDEVIAIQERGS